MPCGPTLIISFGVSEAELHIRRAPTLVEAVTISPEMLSIQVIEDIPKLYFSNIIANVMDSNEIRPITPFVNIASNRFSPGFQAKSLTAT